MSELLERLLDKFKFQFPSQESSLERTRRIGAFWQHFSLHRRQCDASHKNIISVYSALCPYPVWHHDIWVKDSQPPFREYHEGRPFFEQAWELFPQCPIPHNLTGNNENCDYTDDIWFSKNCYLSHHAVNCEDVQYSYRTYNCKSSQYINFSIECELCTDTVNCKNCFEVIYGVNSRQCSNSAFIYDCRNCTHCLFCFNLRHKQYCIGNKQYTKDEYFKEKAKWDFASRSNYSKAIDHFKEIVFSHAVHRAQVIDQCESVTGNYLENCRDSEECFFAHNIQDCVNCIRGEGLKDSIDSMAFDVNVELSLASVNINENCYDLRFCANIVQCNFMEYCLFCFQCKECFGCCGLIGKQFHIFNKPYSEKEYRTLKAKIISEMKACGEYGHFFPGSFAPTLYDESWSGYHMPLTQAEQIQRGFRTGEVDKSEKQRAIRREAIPDNSRNAEETVTTHVYWDEIAEKPFKIAQNDIIFAQSLGVPLSNHHYIVRLQDIYSWLPYRCIMRESTCGNCNCSISTSLPPPYEPRIYCDVCYLDLSPIELQAVLS